MTGLRLRPKDDYFKVASWEQLYILTEKWKSDFEFYRFEFIFLKKLLDKYFIWINDDNNVLQVEKLAVKINQAEQNRFVLNAKSIKHLRHIEEIIDNEFAYDAQIFRDEHEQLEEDIVEFNKNFKELKKEVFTITEYILESENIAHLI